MLVINKGWARCHRARVYLVGGDVGGVGGRILLVGVACAGQAKLAARVLPTLAGTIPVEAKLRQSLAHGGRGLLAERNPNPAGVRPPTDHLGHLPQTAVLLLEQGQNLLGRECPVLLPCLGINRETIIQFRIANFGLRIVGLRLRGGGGANHLFNCADLALSPTGLFL